MTSIPLDAQTLVLKMENGFVTLDARNVSVRQILERWADIGGVTVVNGDRLSTEPVTLSLSHVPERTALETLLREVSGYMFSVREQRAETATLIDRILILPGTAPPRTVGPAAAAVFVAPPTMAPPNEAIHVGVMSIEAPESAGASPRVPVVGNGSGTDFFPSAVTARQPEVPQRPPDMPIRYLDELDENGNRLRAPTIPAADPAAEAAPAAGSKDAVPANPFGITTGSSQPGTISPVPKPSQP